MIEALIFDFDGVIIDTETPEYQTWQEVFQSYGVKLELSLWRQFIGGGVGAFNIYAHLEDLAGLRIERDGVRQRMRPLYLARIDENPVLPGVADYIRTARQMGLKLGIASSSSRDWVEGHLEKRGLLGHFDCITSSNDVARVKPDPELYLSCVSRLNTVPEKALVIEDSANGVMAAKSAGMFCVAVPNPMTRELPLDEADLRLDALTDMPLESLVALAIKQRA